MRKIKRRDSNKSLALRMDQSTRSSALRINVNGVDMKPLLSEAQMPDAVRWEIRRRHLRLDCTTLAGLADKLAGSSVSHREWNGVVREYLSKLSYWDLGVVANEVIVVEAFTSATVSRETILTRCLGMPSFSTAEGPQVGEEWLEDLADMIEDEHIWRSKQEAAA